MEGDLNTEHLAEVVPTVGSHPHLNLRLVKSFVERELLVGILRVCHIVSEQRRLLEVHLLE